MGDEPVGVQCAFAVLAVGGGVPDRDRNLTGFVEDVVTEPTTMPWGNRALLVRDPDGNLVNFFARP
ncbi:hypothetical protein H4W33_009697 [Kibdelosporangium phytohabitans]|nr:hypothetical protein [Kibdelosporangium phytohabitans]